MSGRSKYRSRSRSPRRSRRSRSRSHSSSRRHRDDSHSPMSSRRRHNGDRENPQPNRCIGIFGLSTRTTEQELLDLFTKYGPVDKMQVVIDAKVNISHLLYGSQLKPVRSRRLPKPCSLSLGRFYGLKPACII